MRRAAAILILAASACPAAQPPLALLLGGPVDPSRMRHFSGTGMDAALPPSFFAPGGENALNFVWWQRSDDDMEGGYPPFAECTLSEVPARATAEGGPELPAILSLADCPLDASGAWAGSVTVPAGTGIVEGRVAVCANVTTDTAATVAVGGASRAVPASAGVQVFNLDVRVSAVPATLPVSVAAHPGGQVSLALAVNPWVRFHSCGRLGLGVGGMEIGTPYMTNDWTMCYWRVRYAGAGSVRVETGAIDASGWRAATTNSVTVPWGASIPENIRFRSSPGRFGGFDTVLVEQFGHKFWAGDNFGDDRLWRIYNLDRQELQRRGLWGALPPSPGNP